MPSSHPFSFGLLVGRFQMLHLGHQYMIDTALAICDRVGILVGSSQESGTAVNPFSFELRQEMLRELYGERILIAPLPDIGVGNNSVWGDYVLKSAIRAFGTVPDLAVSGAEGRRTSWFHRPQAAPGAAGETCPVAYETHPATREFAAAPTECGSAEQGFAEHEIANHGTAYHETANHVYLPVSESHVNRSDVQLEPAELFLPKTIDISASALRACLIQDDFATWAKYTDPRLHARYKNLRALVLESALKEETDSL